jgi:hypothetical protein
MVVCDVDKSVVQGLLEMPFSIRSVAGKLTTKMTNEPPPSLSNVKCTVNDYTRAEFHFKCPTTVR